MAFTKIGQILPENVIIKILRRWGQMEYRVTMRSGDERVINQNQLIGRTPLQHGALLYPCAQMCPGPNADGMCRRGARHYNPVPCDHNMYYIKGGFGQKRNDVASKHRKQYPYLIVWMKPKPHYPDTWRIKLQDGHVYSVNKNQIINRGPLKPGSYLLPCRTRCDYPGPDCIKSKAIKPFKKCREDCWYVACIPANSR